MRRRKSEALSWLPVGGTPEPRWILVEADGDVLGRVQYESVVVVTTGVTEYRWIPYNARNVQLDKGFDAIEDAMLCVQMPGQEPSQ